MSPLKKFTLALGVFAAAGVATWALDYRPPAELSAPMQATHKTATLRIDTASTGSTSSPQASSPQATVTVEAEVADTQAKRELGLSNRTHLPEGRGMWFVFAGDGLWSFWMKDTLIPLDILWVSANGTIVTIAHQVKPESYPQAYAPTSPARYVLEVPAGFASRHGIAEGQKVVVE